MLLCELISLTQKQYDEMTVATIPKGPLKELVDLAGKTWCEDRHYMLSDTNQIFPSFIRVANKLGKIIIAHE